MNSIASALIKVIKHSPLAGPLRAMMKRARETYYNAEVLQRLNEKIAPVAVVASDAEPRRINLLIPEIDFRSFYGGYIAKFNLVRRLVDAGHRLRVVMVDRCEGDRRQWQQVISRYEGLDGLLDRIEVENVYDRGRTLRSHPQDALIATTWWTAHIAQQWVRQLERDRFVYMIQEYEPFTFPMGSYYAMAHASYDFPHHALFSSDLLREYFERNGHGVYRNGGAGGEGLAFENAILKFTVDEAGMRARRPRRLLFYARPEAHAARNMFEIGYLALAQAIEQGLFPAGEWEFYGIGTGHGDIPLPRGERLRMLGKVGLAEYRELLGRHDIGLSLMYTPHPSLLPLEMAAAGLLVVTNECMNKTAAAMAAISPNIIAGQPTVEGVCASLGEAVTRSGDVTGRVAGAAVNWSNDWGRTFSAQHMAALERWLA
jgi:hypothetical protein